MIFASLETYKLSCYCQDVMFPAQNEHGFPRMHCEKREIMSTVRLLFVVSVLCDGHADLRTKVSGRLCARTGYVTKALKFS